MRDELAHIEKNVLRQFGDTAVQAVLLSEALGRDIEIKLNNKNITLAGLPGKPDYLKELLGDELNLLLLSLERTKCTGVYMILDATVNPNAPQAARSRAGLYIQNSEPVIPAINSQKVFLRGFADLALENGLGLQAHWDLEFDITIQDYFVKLRDVYKENPSLSLSRLYCWHFANSLNFVGEKTLLCSIPILDSDGAFMGICGFEINGANFNQYNTPNQKTYHHLFTVVAQAGENINLDEALFAGSPVTPAGEAALSGGSGGLYLYRSSAASFIGNHSILPLFRDKSPYDDQFVLILAMPAQDYNGYVWENNLQLIVIFSVLLALGTALSVFVIRRYIRQAAVKKPPNLEGLRLSPREKEICLLLLRGLSLKQIGYELHISFDTVNSHYRSLYRKLGISSKAELFIKFRV
jgi:DNA-binding CsgD family transcriptional regulator